MSFVKVLWFWPSVLRVRRGARIPIRVYHLLTKRCNLKCPYCLVDDIKKSSVRELSAPEIIATMKEFRALGTKLWIFGGGEPTIREELPELISAAKSMGMLTGMSSNGYRILDFLPACKELDYLQMSIDGPEEYHDSVRGKGSFNKLIKAMEGLKSINKNFVLNCVISEKNIQHLDFVCSLARDFKSMIELSPEIAVATDLVDSDKSNVDMDKIVDIVLKKKKEYWNIITLSSYLERLRDLQNGKIDRFTPACQAGKSYCALSADGIVYICFNKMVGLDVDDARKLSIKDQFENLKHPTCDCCYRCLYKLNNLRTITLKQSLSYGFKVLKNGDARDVIDFLRATNL